MSERFEAEATPQSGPRVSAVAGAWAPHLLCLMIPASICLFLNTTPHPSGQLALWLCLPLVTMALDAFGPRTPHEPDLRLPGLPFDALLLSLAGIHFVNVLLLARLVSHHGLAWNQSWVALYLVGNSSALAGIVTAHELIHRRSRAMRLLGRSMLAVLHYEHFATEHIRGHHARAATPDDPATARHGESFLHFLPRTLIGQLRSAWLLEQKRLRRLGSGSLVRNRIVQGAAAGVAFSSGILVVYGLDAWTAHICQAAIAVVLLECTNYFQHWGLQRNRSLRGIDSWDTDSFFTLYALVGLSRHSDHHRNPSRPYQQLRDRPESPRLPAGYFVLVAWTLFANRSLRRSLDRRLKESGLGPYRNPGSGSSNEEVGAH